MTPVVWDDDAQAEPAPKRAEQIPTVNSPIILSEVSEQRSSFWAGVITGGVLLVVTVVLVIVGMVVS